MRGLDRYDTAPVEYVRGATRRAFENLVQLCVDERAELLLIAGDVHDDDWHDYATGLFFASQLARLWEAGVQVVWIRGNHDAASKITKRLKLPDGVHELPHGRPGTVALDELGVFVHGQSYGRAAELDNLARYYPPPVRGGFNIGLLHTSLDGREGHAPYAPCRAIELVDHGYDYWALGHVHQREVLHREPWVVFPGNLQGRHARECGSKGATVLSLVDQRVVNVEHHALDVVRWERCVVDARQLATPDDVLERIRTDLEVLADSAGQRLLAARVIVQGRSPAHAALCSAPERWINEVRQLGHFMRTPVWIEKVTFATELELELDELATRDDALGQLARSFRELHDDSAELTRLFAALEPVWRALPGDLKQSDLPQLDDPATVKRLLKDVEQLVLPRLYQSEDNS